MLRPDSNQAGRGDAKVINEKVCINEVQSSPGTGKRVPFPTSQRACKVRRVRPGRVGLFVLSAS